MHPSMPTYVAERYPEYASYSDAYTKYLKDEGFEVVSCLYGFITYKFQGDACIINDIYIATPYRKTKKAWELFRMLREIVQSNPNCRVLIGFSEKCGQGKEHGIGAMTTAGFIKAFETSDATVYMRGAY